MTRPARRAAGFTLIEMMITVAVVGIIAALATVSLARVRPRANLAGAAVELHSLLHAARQQALAAGQDVAVLVFPGYSPRAGEVGRIIVYQDGDHTLFDETAADNFDDYDPAKIRCGPKSEILSSLDLPAGVVVGPATGLGAGEVLPAPLAAIPVNLDCTFCDGDKAARRGAVVFDSRGRARFYSKAGVPLAVSGGSVSLEAPALGTGAQGQVKALTVVGSTGAVSVIDRG